MSHQFLCCLLDKVTTVITLSYINLQAYHNFVLAVNRTSTDIRES